MAINPLKEFFKRKKAEVKFARAGPGQKLSSEGSSASGGPATSAKEAAAEAAMKRFSKQNNDRPTQKSRLATNQSGIANSIPSNSSNVAKSSQENTDSKDRKELQIIDGIPLRNVQIYTAEELAHRIRQPDLDDDDFRLTQEDVSLFKQRYEEEKARNEILKTSEMRKREMEAKRPTTNVARIRFKLPNNQIIEASFSGSELFSSLRLWLEQACRELAGFDLGSYDILFGLRPIKGVDLNKSVKELNLIPATTLTIVSKVM